MHCNALCSVNYTAHSLHYALCSNKDIYNLLADLADTGEISLDKQGKGGSPNLWKKAEVDPVGGGELHKIMEEPVGGGELQEVSNSPFLIFSSSLPSAGTFCNGTQEQPLRLLSLRSPLLYRRLWQSQVLTIPLIPPPSSPPLPSTIATSNPPPGRSPPVLSVICPSAAPSTCSWRPTALRPPPSLPTTWSTLGSWPGDRCTGTGEQTLLPLSTVSLHLWSRSTVS